MTDINETLVQRGPTPSVGGPITLRAQSDMDENTVVTFGTEDQTCEVCGATDYPLGWLQAAVDEDDLTHVYLFSPVWRVRLGSTSDAVSFGDTLECAASGEVIRAESGSSSTIIGKAMQDGTAGNTINMIPIVCCPEYTSS